jgi:hypothetical protein
MDALKARWKAAWHDPVGSKVIAAVIVGVPTVIWTTREVIVSGVSGAIDRAAAALGAGWDWLETPAPLSHLGVLVFIAILAWFAASFRRLRRRVDRMDSKLFYSSLGDLTEQITDLQGLRREVAEGAREASPEVVAEGFEPNRIQMLAAKVLTDQYPKRLQLPDLAAGMQNVAYRGVHPVMSVPVAPQAEIARQMEDMQQKGVATIDDPNSVMAYYGLTRHGRDFMLEKLRPPPPQARGADPQRSALRALDDPKDDQKKS